ncbi:hypothetical protein Amsp01_047530 [Amycolatopsis sp. NBRC 101858]|nr:hypothetical protein Amsp01_047530 [Amycolatopsis sp. NBRC 101858]
MALDSVTPRNGQAEVTLAGECGGGGCGVVGGCEPGPGPSAGASDDGPVVGGLAEAEAEVAVVVVDCATGAGVEHAVTTASAPIDSRIPPRFPISAG